MSSKIRLGFALVFPLVLTAATGGAEDRVRAFDVTDYGGRADSAHDNSPAIREAISAAAEAGGGRIVLPPADRPYLITDSILLNGNNLHLVAGGATVLLKDGAATGRTSTADMVHIVRIQGTADSPIENLSVRGLRIDANYWGQTNNAASTKQSSKLAGITRGIMIKHAKNVVIDSVTIDRSFVGMTFGRGSHHCEARNVKVTRFHHDAFGVTPGYTDRGASHIVFRDCVASDAPNGARGGLPGTRVKGWEIEEGAQHVKLIDCVVRDTDANGFYVRPHGSRGKYYTGQIELIRCRVENAGGNAFMAKSYTHLQPVSHVSFIDCVAVDGVLAIHTCPDQVFVKAGRFGQVTIGYFKDYDDPHHLPDGPWKKFYKHLPVRSVSIEGAKIIGDVRINATEGHDGEQSYIPEISLTNLTVGGDVYTIGSESFVQMESCTVAGARRILTPEAYFKSLHSAHAPVPPSSGQ